MTGKDWVLYDGECGFCRWCAAWIKRRDAQGKFRVVPFQQAPSPPMTDGLRRKCEQAVHVITERGEVLKAGRATVYVLSSLPHVGWLRVFLYPPLVWVAEGAYWLVARSRGIISRFVSIGNSGE